MPAARTTDPQTSHEAAVSVTGVSDTKQRILAMFADGLGRSDEQIARQWGVARFLDESWPQVSPSGLRSRRAELVADGMLEDSGMRVRMQSGRMAIVWQKPIDGGLW